MSSLAEQAHASYHSSGHGFPEGTRVGNAESVLGAEVRGTSHRAAHVDRFAYRLVLVSKVRRAHPLHQGAFPCLHEHCREEVWSVLFNLLFFFLLLDWLARVGVQTPIPPIVIESVDTDFEGSFELLLPLHLGSYLSLEHLRSLLDHKLLSLQLPRLIIFVISCRVINDLVEGSKVAVCTNTLELGFPLTPFNAWLPALDQVRLADLVSVLPVVLLGNLVSDAQMGLLGLMDCLEGVDCRREPRCVS